MKRAQDAMEDMRGRVDFVTRREFDQLRSEIDALRAQVERHMSHGGHHSHAAGSGTGGGTGTGGTGTGGTGTGTGTGGNGLRRQCAGDGSPGL
jgi:hypothetical protein